jgi:hypothetical protein
MIKSTANISPFSDVMFVENIQKNIDLLMEHMGHQKSDYKRRDFFSSLNKLQKDEYSIDDFREYPKLITQPQENELLTLKHLMTVDELQKDWMYSNEELKIIESKTIRALKIIEEQLPELYSVFNRLVGALIFGKRGGFHGGSISDVIGIIWLAPKDDWGVNTYAEHIFHEFTHQVLFLDDMINCIFPKSVPDMIDDKVVSSILHINRGYDKSYHSAFVSYSIIQLREKLGLDWDELWEPLKTTVSGLIEKGDVLSQHGYNQVLDLNNRIIEMDEVA